MNPRGWELADMTTQLLLRILLASLGLLAGFWYLIRVHREAKYEKRRLELALAGSKIALWDWSSTNGFIRRRKSYADMLGYGQDTLIQEQDFASALIHPEDLPRIEDALESYLSGTTPSFEEELRLLDAQGTWRWALARAVVVAYDRRRRPTKVVGVTIDITDRKQVEMQLRELSYRDPVTGLHNRTYFDLKVQELDRPEALPLSIIMGDLNFLKMANDTFGHDAGDSLLASAAKILKSCCRADDIVTRWGGDEFAILLPNTTEEEAVSICERIRTACAQAQKNPVQLSVAVGAATRTSMAEPVEGVIRSAEDWMYKYKIMERGEDTQRWEAITKRLAHLC